MNSQNKIIISIMFFLTLLFTGCTIEPDTLDEKTSFMLDVLYTHTGQMKDYYTPSELTQIKDFNINLLVDEFETDLDADTKIEILEKVYNMKSTGTYKEKIKQLEDKMVIVMYAAIEDLE